jgi:hypothetical protein
MLVFINNILFRHVHIYLITHSSSHAKTIDFLPFQMSNGVVSLEEIMGRIIKALKCI